MKYENIYCDKYGYTDENKVLSYFFCCSDSQVDFDELYELEVKNKVRLKKVLNDLLKKDFIKEIKVDHRKAYFRNTGKDLVYELNNNKKKIKLLLKKFKKCIIQQDKNIIKNNI